MKIAVITCSSDSDITRDRTLVAGLKSDQRVRLTVIKNSHQSFLRYPEVIWKLMRARLTRNPNVYVLTYRGRVLLPFVLWLAGHRPVIFDEYMVPIIQSGSSLASQPNSFKRFLMAVYRPLYKNWLRRCRYVLTDTQSQAGLSARISHVNMRQYRIIPVGTDEKTFHPSDLSKSELVALPFRVLIEGDNSSSAELSLVLQAAEQLQSKTEINFLVAGSSKSAANAVQKAQESGAHVFYRETSTPDELAATIRESTLTLSGLLGTTISSQNVIPNQAYQSLASAVTITIAQNEAPSALFADKDTVLLVGPEDVPALVKVINWAANNRQTLVDIGRNGRHLYERSFSQPFIDSELSKIVDDLS